MDIQHISGRDIAATLLRLIKQHEKFYWAVAWGSENPALAELLQYRKKISRLFIGTHFYQTPPSFLEKIKDIDNVRVIAPHGATFHPKVYLFRSLKSSALVIGSANFTHSAMEQNVEACCLIEGAASESLFNDVQRFITTECWEKAAIIDPEFLRAYRIQYEAINMSRASFQKFTQLRRPKPSRICNDLMEMEWAEFVTKVRAENYFQERLKVLAQAKIIFDTANNFSELTQYNRKAIAGTLGIRESQAGGVDWGLFGGMFGFGVLKKLINNDPDKISDALDCIPPVGVVTRENYDEFVNHYLEAFEGKSRVGGITSASRFLAMRRPDSFVCIDKQNKTALSAHFGFAASAVNLENYWQYVVEPMCASPWWQAPRPRGTEGRIWDGRAAFLDSLFYRPEQS